MLQQQNQLYIAQSHFFLLARQTSRRVWWHMGDRHFTVGNARYPLGAARPLAKGQRRPASPQRGVGQAGLPPGGLPPRARRGKEEGEGRRRDSAVPPKPLGQGPHATGHQRELFGREAGMAGSRKNVPFATESPP